MSNKNSILLMDPQFDPSTASDCTLLLKISPDSFCYAIIDQNTKHLKALYDHQECGDTALALKKSMKSDAYLSLPFKEIKASVYTLNTMALKNEMLEVE